MQGNSLTGSEKKPKSKEKKNLTSTIGYAKSQKMQLFCFT